MTDTIAIREVGPREGFQFEKGQIPTDRKIELVDALSETGVRHIQVTSFVSPKWVPQMADADDVAARFRRVDGVDYEALFLNRQGLERAVAAGRFDVRGKLSVTATDEFGKRNVNKSIQEQLDELPGRLDMYEGFGVPVGQVGVSAAFGCNFGGDVPLARVLDLLDAQLRIAGDRGLAIHEVMLADTMGWANPRQVKETVAAVYERWPGVGLSLHLHDTRAMAMANAAAAMELGVRDFDASVGGLGGCPFSGSTAAAGNICTEDLVFLSEELGIQSGIDLDLMIRCAKLAEEIVGHELPGKLMKSGGLAAIRSGVREGARA